MLHSDTFLLDARQNLITLIPFCIWNFLFEFVDAWFVFLLFGSSQFNLEFFPLGDLDKNVKTFLDIVKYRPAHTFVFVLPSAESGVWTSWSPNSTYLHLNFYPMSTYKYKRHSRAICYVWTQYVCRSHFMTDKYYYTQGQSQHKIYIFGVLFCNSANLSQVESHKSSSLVFPFMFIFVLEFSSNTFTKCNIGWQLSTNIWKRNGAILHVCFNMELRSSLQYGVCTERPAFANFNIAKL